MASNFAVKEVITAFSSVSTNDSTFKTMEPASARVNNQGTIAMKACTIFSLVVIFFVVKT